MKLDGYGLHAVDCDCPLCEQGFRPTATQRANARLWALQRGKESAATKRAIERDEQHRAEVERTDRMLAEKVKVKLPTPEERAELRALRERLFHGTGQGHR